MKLGTQWTKDCHGKQDYDGDIVILSTRYWPRGGGFSTFDTDTLEWCHNDTRPGIKPSAHASILLVNGSEQHDESDTLDEIDIEGESEAEVKAKIEQWAGDRFKRIEAAVRREFCKGGA